MIELKNNDFSPLRDFGLVYLASPYSKYPWGLDEACRDICKISGRFILQNISIFSPIAHTHPIAMAAGIDPLDYDIWIPADKPFVDMCEAMVVVQMSGWDTSYGVTGEIEEFEKAKKPIFSYNPGPFR